MNAKKNNLLILCLLLGTLTPLSIDSLLPALPHISNELSIQPSSAQLILNLFLISFSFSQIFCGVLSDHYGRKRILLLGLLLYLIASLLFIVSSTATFLYMSRFFQGIGSCITTISAYALIRDYWNEKENLRILSYLATTMTVVPSIAPVFGGFITSCLSWRFIFILPILLSIACVFIGTKTLPTTSISSKKPNLQHILKNYKNMLTNYFYLKNTLCGAIIFIIFYLFISFSPFIAMNTIKISSAYLGLLLTINALFLAIGNYLPAVLIRITDNTTCLKIGVYITLIGAALFLWNSFHILSVENLFIPMFICSVGVGIATPTSMANSLESFKDTSAQATALAIFVRFFSAGIISTISFHSSLKIFTLLATLIIVGSIINWLLICMPNNFLLMKAKRL